jgi:hypothetical protein
MNRTAARSLACALAGVLLLGGCAAGADSTSHQKGTAVTSTLSLEQQMARERATLLPMVQAVAARFGANPHQGNGKRYDGREMACGVSNTGQTSPRQWTYDLLLDVPARDALAKAEQVLVALEGDGWTRNPPRRRDAEVIAQDVFKDGYLVSVGATRQGLVTLTGRSACYAEDGTLSFRMEAGQ